MNIDIPVVKILRTTAVNLENVHGFPCIELATPVSRATGTWKSAWRFYSNLRA